MSAAEVQHPSGEEQPGSLRELLRVAVPLVISTGSLSLMHVVDRVMLTWYSTDALAASTPGGMLHWTLFSFPFGVAMYVNTFVAQYEGAQRPDRVAAAVWQGLWMGLVAGGLLAVTAPWTRQLTGLFGHTESITRLESDYFTVLAIGSPAGLISGVLSSFFSGRGRTKVIAAINIVITLVNAGCNAVLIFGAGPVPSLGIQGAAWGTVIAQIVGCGLFIAWIRVDPESRSYPLGEQWRFDRALSARLFKYGLPNGLQYVTDVGAFLLLLVFIGRIGSQELAATNLAFNLNSLAFIPLFGMGTAVSILVGQRVGEGRPQLAIRTTWLAFGMAALYTGVWAVLYVVAPDLMLAPFARHSDPAEFAELRDIVVTLLYFVTAYMWFDAMAVVFGSAIRGAGDTHFSLLFNTAVLWLLMVLPVFVIYHKGGGLYACWVALCVQLLFLGTGFLLRFMGGKWLTMKVIEHTLVGVQVPSMMEEPGALVATSSIETESVLEAAEGGATPGGGS
ncbi:MAG: MATE family efflux transporter [Planctomycetaceae bacterium]